VKGNALPLLGVFAIALIVWISLTMAWYAPIRPNPTTPTIGSGFEGTAQLPKEEITRHFDNARARMLAINKHGQEFSVVGDVSG
jgi:hypothetical protein